MSETPIAHVADTAFWVATYRANESARPDALFRDPLAARLVEGRGRDIADRIADGPQVAWVVVMRTCIIDDFIRQAVAGGCDTILNLGAGLDTRPYRLELPSSLRWIEVDFPEVISWKEQRLQGAIPTCHLERVPLDLTDMTARRSLFARVGADSARTLVLTEGVVPYLTNDAVGALADDLRRIRGAQWIVDYVSPGALRYRKRLRVSRQMQAAPFQFAPPDWFDFFEAHGWRALNINYLPIEARQLGRPAPLPGWIRLGLRATRWLRPGRALDGFRKSMAYILLEPLSKKQV